MGSSLQRTVPFEGRRKRRRKSERFHGVTSVFVLVILGGTLQILTSLNPPTLPPDAIILPTQIPMESTGQEAAASLSPLKLATEWRVPQTSETGWAPRIVLLDVSLQANVLDNATILSKTRTLEPLGGPCPYCLVEPDDYIYPFERPYYEECTPMVKWQNMVYPTCNALHEIPLGEPATFALHSNSTRLTDHVHLLSLSGSWRSVWRRTTEYNETVVLKLLKFDRRRFDHESYEYHRIDAMAMERLTSSPFVVDIFAFCGQSVMTEYASGTARAHTKNKKFNSRQRLKMARDLARALSHVHSIDYPNSTNATFSHNDINIANVVEAGGRIKLNDFNIGNLLRWNQTQPCGTPVRFAAPFWKSPEENANTSYVNAAQTDVFGLGNLLFQVMTTRQPWTHLEPNGKLTDDQVVQRKAAGQVPFVPPEIAASPKIALSALYFATMACFRLNPDDRPTSYELALGLDTALQWSRQGKNVSRAQVEQLFVRNRRIENLENVRR